MQRMIALSLLMFGVTGCYAGVRGGEATKDDVKGLRYFLAAPFLIIEEQPNDRWTARIELGADRSREFAIQPWTVLASSTANVEFHPDGTLKSFKLEQDTTKVPEAVVNALKDVQLKRIELEQADLERRLEEAKKTDAKREGEGEVRGEARRVYVYKVHGTTLVPKAGQVVVRVPAPEAPARIGGGGGAGRLVADVRGDVLEISNMDQTKIGGMRFFDKDGNALPAPTTSALRQKVGLASGKAAIALAELRNAKVDRIVVGNDVVDCRTGKWC
jgi:hypothetical protein